MLKFLKLPNFNTYEDMLGSSWLSIRISTVLCLVMAFQSKVVIDQFSLFESWTMNIHSYLITLLIAAAILTFTVKIHNVPEVKSYEKNWLKIQLICLVIFFASVEFMLQMAYHVIWHNKKNGLTEFTFPELTPEMILMLCIDAMLPIALFFYAHTAHIKTKSEIVEITHDNPPINIPGPEIPERLIGVGDDIVLKSSTGKVSTLNILKKDEKITKKDDSNDTNVVNDSSNLNKREDENKKSLPDNEAH